jgi:Bacterial Ig-like domain (group 3)
MRAHRSQDAASNPRGHRFGAGVVRLLAVTAVTATACAMMAGAASAATRHATKTHVSVSPKTALIGAAVRLSATVSSPGRHPAGKVTFTWNNRTLCVARLRNGKAACDATFSSARGYWVKASYPRNGSFWGSWGLARVTVVKYTTVTTIAAPSPTTSPVTMTADVTTTVNGLNLTRMAGGMGSVTFYVGTTAAGMAAVSTCTNLPLTTFNPVTGNTVTCTDTLAAGSYFIKAVYIGDTVTNGSNSGTPASANLTIS